MKNEVYQQSQQGLDLLYESIIELLNANPNGLSNAEITQKLGLQSEHNGKQKDYLSYSLLGNLMMQNKVKKFRQDGQKNKSRYRTC